MKRFVCLVLCALTVILSLPSAARAKERPGFDDLPETAWYHDAVLAACEAGYFSGTGNGHFSPESHLTRAMLVQCLARAADADLSRYTDTVFTEVPAGRWYTAAVGWAQANGIVAGTGGGCFSPDGIVNREQLCVILFGFAVRFGAPIEYKFDYLPFADDAQISLWAHEDVHSLRSCGAVSDRSSGYFVPKACATRAEVAVMLLSLMGGIKEPPADPEIHVYSLTLGESALSLVEGEARTLSATLLPENASDRRILWTSSDEGVVSVSDAGALAAGHEGSAVITAVAEDGELCARCEVTVKKKTPEPPAGRYIDPNKPMIALTFDDGPSKYASDMILDTLEKYGVVATFFEQGCNVERYPAVVAREVALGCEIGNHSYDHPQLTKLSYPALRSQIDRTQQAFTNAVGFAPTLMRPPYGAHSALTDRSINMPLILWSVDTLDWKSRNANSVYNAAMRGAYDGAIILMHSLYTSTAQATERIVPALIAQGYQLVTVSELAYYRGYSLENSACYSSFK